MTEEKIVLRDRRTEQRYFVDNVIIDHYGPIIGAYGIAIYSVLVRYSNADTGRDSWPAYKTIAEKAGCSVRKAQDVVQQLADLKLISIVPRYTDSGQTSNEYLILDPPCTTCTPPMHHMHPKNPHSKNPQKDSLPALPAKGEYPKPSKSQAKKELEKEFSILTNLPVPKRQTDKQRKEAAVRWWNPLLEIAELVDFDIGKARTLMKKAISDMRKQNLTIRAPQSILSNVLSEYSLECSRTKPAEPDVEWVPLTPEEVKAEREKKNANRKANGLPVVDVMAIASQQNNRRDSDRSWRYIPRGGHPGYESPLDALLASPNLGRNDGTESGEQPGDF